MKILPVVEKHVTYTSFVRFSGREKGGGVSCLMESLVAAGCISVWVEWGGVGGVLVWSTGRCVLYSQYALAPLLQIEGGGVLTSLLMISGQDDMNPASSALYSIDRAGFLSAPWRNTTLSVTVAYGVVLSLTARTNIDMFCAEM